ncbi:PDZ domain-containing protein [Roseiconus nitratireducens]|uniref:PDZ domain-containing protein n=1 Tax=Roseiconus nitratireducens TaxID=2605748 RepID=A0A5M6DA28_9BACT|nr:trypsin-like peptidase domain-containing protein [Roseiconus nitratireducens]KAA5544418.1 PDZ domain-containing protein [Roseiconus nitratireducens]
MDHSPRRFTPEPSVDGTQPVQSQPAECRPEPPHPALPPILPDVSAHEVSADIASADETTASDPAEAPPRLSFEAIDVAAGADCDPSNGDHLLSQHVPAEARLAEHRLAEVNRSATALTESAAGEPPIEVTLDDVVCESAPRTIPAPRRGEPILHSLVLLATILIMLGAARFVVPGIVEEIRYAQHRGQLRAEFEVASEGLRNVSLDTLSQAYQMVTAAAGPSVVHINVTRNSDPGMRGVNYRDSAPMPVSDQGSGVIVDPAGFVLTNRHVIADGEEIEVTLSDGRTVVASVTGTDPVTDLAVLKIDADRLIPIPWGDSERIRVGSPVWAIGSPFGLDRTVTFGILSGKHRVIRASERYQDFMQSDVAVNPGNSGGPLVDSKGTLIGINTAIVGDTYQGVSFSIPSAVAKKVYEQIRKSGSVARGWLGVSLEEVPDALVAGDNYRVRGARVDSLADNGSGAAKAGLQPGDIIAKVDAEPIRDVLHLIQVIGNAMAGTQVRLSVIRDTQQFEVDVLLGERPAPLVLR